MASFKFENSEKKLIVHCQRKERVGYERGTRTKGARFAEKNSNGKRADEEDQALILFLLQRIIDLFCYFCNSIADIICFFCTLFLFLSQIKKFPGDVKRGEDGNLYIVT